MNLVKIENMTGPAELEHHIVGDVDERAHAALTAACQAVHHPGWRFGAGINAAHDAAGEAAAQIGSRNSHWQPVGMACCHDGKAGHCQGRASDGGDFARHAIDA